MKRAKVIVMWLLTVAALAAWMPMASWILLNGVDWWTGSDLFWHFEHIARAQWWAYFWSKRRDPDIDIWLMVSAFVATIPVLVCVAGWFSLLRKKPDLYGKADWAKADDMRKAGLRLTRRPP